MDQENEQKASEQEAGDLWQEIQDVKLDLAVQTATQAGAQATQAATQAGAQATQAATQAGAQATQAASLAGSQATQAAALSGLGMTVGAGFIAFVLGMFLGINVNKTR